MKKKGVNRPEFIERKVLRVALRPFSWFYGFMLDIRNGLYDRSLLRAVPSDQFSVVVGNLTVGGTGKTPTIEYLIENLGAENIVVLSRGYGRKSRGFVLATDESTAELIGDEPLQFYKKFGTQVKVAVCENRVTGSQELHRLFPERRLLLLDDAFQHRAFQADIRILLNDYNRPFYQDEPLPGGRLRENRRGAGRADAVIVTKCPALLSDEHQRAIRKKLSRYLRPEAPIFFSWVQYSQVKGFDHTELRPRSVVLITGIAQPAPLEHFVREHFVLCATRFFSDHHTYSVKDVQEILEITEKNTIVLTTEKDMVKLRPLAVAMGVSAKFAYLPIVMRFGPDTDSFSKWLERNVRVPVARRQQNR